MATRTIVTSQPDVACDVCGRRLLRGEQPDVFLSAGRRLLVCELCAPRATFEGWMRETDSQSLSLPPMRPRRGRSLIDRLPVSLRARLAVKPAAADDELSEDLTTGDLFSATASSPQREQAATPVRAPASSPQGEEVAAALTPSEAGAEPAQPNQHVERSDEHMHSEEHRQAVTVFNASQLPRRVAGVARSLGEPSVTVRSAEHLSSVVTIVVAWELCWYRYEVDLSEPVVEAQVIDQGTEVTQLAREDRVANAAAASDGTLSLV